jgi:hypothetical protein
VCAVLALGLLAVSCRGWREEDRFIRELRCGMSIDDVRARARSLHASQFYDDARVPVLNGTHTVAEGSSRVYLSFSTGGLRWFRTAEQVGFTGMRAGLKYDLCSGGKFVSLVIDGNPQWGRATVTVDGAAIGTLSGGQLAFLEADVPLGEHELLIQTPPYVYRQRLSFDDRSDGVDRIHLPQYGPRSGS